MQKLASSRLLTVLSTRTFHFSPDLVGGALVAQVGSKSCTFDGENEEESAYFRQRYEEIVDYVSSKCNTPILSTRLILQVSSLYVI